GIRDLYVTGVQTCALPISRCCARVAPGATSNAAAKANPAAMRTRFPVRFIYSFLSIRGIRKSNFRCSGLAVPQSVFLAAPRFFRSEERRVGKEGRSRKPLD